MILAGGSYFAIVFAVAFAVGVVRVLVVAPRLGEVGAVLLEAPIILTLSWFVSGWCVRRFAVGPTAAERLSIGLMAFGLLMAAEAGLAVLVFGQTLDDHFTAYAGLAGALGLAAQMGFALTPWVQGRLARRA